MMRSLALTALAVLTLAACDSNSEEVVDLQAQIATSIEADPTVSDGNGPPSSTGRFTLYDLDAGEIVLSSSEANASVRQQDSTSTVWDIGFNGTKIIFNGGTSGPGEGSALILRQPFAEVTEAPASGYIADGSNTDCTGDPYAICTGSDNGWYNYNGQTNYVSPLAGRTIVLTTGDGNYAKVRILNYYQGNPSTPDPSLPSRYYTFEYVVQPDGSRDFETTVVED